MAKEFSYITGENAGDDQKGRLAYLTKYWDNLPNFYEEGGRGAKGFFKNLGSYPRFEKLGLPSDWPK